MDGVLHYMILPKDKSSYMKLKLSKSLAKFFE